MLRIENLKKTFQSGHDVVRAVDDVTLEVERGELLVLLGPSGCGKTTLLRCIAGLESADSGSIAFGDEVVFDGARRIDRPPNKRNIGMVFQSYALWPHKTVRKNIAYPLTVRGLKRELRNEGWVESAAELVDCGHLLDRYPGQLSGGQQQRIALARGLVARPDVLLFDEPLSNLDALLRTQVRNELHEMHGRIGFTAVYVTHDQTEALALGDRLAIMRTGAVEQIGTPHEVYERPVSEYAAHFVGFANHVALKRTTDGWATEDGDAIAASLPVPRQYDSVHLRFRPEFARVAPDGSAADGHISLPARFVDQVYAGSFDETTVEIGSSSLVVRSEASLGQPSLGEDVTVQVPCSRARWYTTDGVAIEEAADTPLPVSD